MTLANARNVPNSFDSITLYYSIKIIINQGLTWGDFCGIICYGWEIVLRVGASILEYSNILLRSENSLLLIS